MGTLDRNPGIECGSLYLPTRLRGLRLSSTNQIWIARRLEL